MTDIDADVYISRNLCHSSRKYHLTENCPNGPSRGRWISPDVRERMDVELCSICSGEADSAPSKEDFGHLRSIKAAAEAQQ